jgi:FkbM family methyltransferase
MNIKNQAKQLLRMSGHAFGITIHERLNVFQETLNELQQQNIQLAQNHTALLQSSLFLVQRDVDQKKLLREHEDRISNLVQSSFVEHVNERVAASVEHSQQTVLECLAALRNDLEHIGLKQGDEEVLSQNALVERINASFTPVIEYSKALAESLSSLQIEMDRRASLQAAELAALRSETRQFLNEHATRQICIETTDYATSNPEIGLLSYLYSYLPSRNVIDVGAHTGIVSEYLLRAGYEVYAFEPFPESYDRLVKHLGGNSRFHPHNVALGRINTQLPLHLAADLSGTKKYDDASVFHSLSPHSMPEDLPFRDAVLVPVKTLADLHDGNVVPEDVSVVKIDTEGYDLEVIRGMGNRTYPVVGVEYWDTRIPFGKSGLLYTCESMVEEMRRRGYHWYIVIFRVWGQNQTGYYCNHDRPVPESWGNIYFFREREVFSHAREWCSAALPHTYFKPVPV